VSRLKNPAKWKPPGYDPELMLWLRRSLEGGTLLNPGELRPRTSARRECLVLAHGFNNHAGEAAEAYSLGFRARQYEQYPELPRGSLEKRLGDGYWPGDADWPGPLDWLDFMVYPFAVHTAKSAGPLLARAIRDLPNLERIDFIGHSLGCRLVLEAAEDLTTLGGPMIGRICLMAAAVPNEMVGPGGRFDPLLLRLVDRGVKIHVMHSDKDPVLRFAFPPGQALAAELSLTALGLYGPPADMIGVGGMVTQVKVAGARHGDYWGHNDSKARTQAVREAGTFLRIGHTARTLTARAVGDGRVVGEARDVGAAREIG